MLAMQQGINMRGGMGSSPIGSKHMNHLGGRQNNSMSSFNIGRSSPPRQEDELGYNDEDDMDGNEDEDDDGGDGFTIKGEELNYFRLNVPCGISEQQLQHIVDCHFYPAGNGGCKPPNRPKRRRYDNTKLERVFQNGSEVFNSLMRNSRKHFARYFFIKDQDVVELIDRSTNVMGGVDRNSDGFHEAYSKVTEWRKNWHAKFAKVVDECLLALVEKHPELKDVPKPDLPLAYARFYKYETMYAMLGQVQCIVDLRACMGIENIKWFYETLFSWSLTYAHMSRFLAGEEGISRGEYLRRIRLIGHQKEFEHIRLTDIVFLPDKPVSKLRNTPKKKVRGNDVLEGFAVVAGGAILSNPIVEPNQDLGVPESESNQQMYQNIDPALLSGESGTEGS
ncbi:hypothetical protein BGX38DRAFT_1292252 [Terfezia claveryi]|nr:hypothetical protein BGX38DRAFT_1292252 [Terfezia claveryi]